MMTPPMKRAPPATGCNRTWWPVPKSTTMVSFLKSRRGGKRVDDPIGAEVSGSSDVEHDGKSGLRIDPQRLARRGCLDASQQALRDGGRKPTPRLPREFLAWNARPASGAR